MKKNALFSLVAIVISLSTLSVANSMNSKTQVGAAAMYGGYCAASEGHDFWGGAASAAGALVAGAGGVGCAGAAGVGSAAAAAASNPVGWAIGGAALIL